MFFSTKRGFVVVRGNAIISIKVQLLFE